MSTLLQNVNKKAVTFSVYSTRQIIVAIAVAEEKVGRVIRF